MTTYQIPLVERPGVAAPVGPGTAAPATPGSVIGVGPVRLIVQATAALLALAALCAVALVGTGSAGSDTEALRQEVQGRAAVAAELHFALADLDAQRADELVPGHAAHNPLEQVGDPLEALIIADQRRAEISGLMRELGADPSQGPRVQAMFDALGRYDELSGQAGYVDGLHSDRPAGHPPAVAVNFSAQAAAVMRDQLLPAVDTLDRDYLARAVALQRTAHAEAVRNAFVTGGVGAAAIAVLGWWQLDLNRRHRRRINPALAVATAAVVAVTLAAVTGLLSAAWELDRAGQDGLLPWSRLAQAQEVAADAAAAQSRWFVQDPGAAATYRADYDVQMRQLGGLITPPPGTGGTELPQYAATSQPLAAFRADDTTLRRLVGQGRLDDAAVVLTEVGRGRVAFDYWDFATRLQALGATRRADFESASAAAGSALDGWPVVPACVLGAAGLLVLAGVRPRLAEYR